MKSRVQSTPGANPELSFKLAMRSPPRHHLGWMLGLLIASAGCLIAGSLQADAADEIPADETGINIESLSASTKSDTSAISGSFGKCLKGADTRCYYMDIAEQGSVTILSYISQRKNQFDEDPGTDKPHCYKKVQRQLAKLGDYTYAWSNESLTDATAWMKIRVSDVGLQVFSADREKLRLPAISPQERSNLTVCER